MSRGTLHRRPRSAAPWWRCLAVWSSASAVLAAGLWLSVDTACQGVGDRLPGFEGLLVTGAASVATVSLAWLWLLVSLAVVEAARGATIARSPGLVRRTVLLACGGALALGVASPALASPLVAASDPARSPVAESALLSGLPLPDRATAGSPSGRRPGHPGGTTWRVAGGDSLWSIAATTLPDTATTAQVDRRWREIHRLNRPTIGSDPDVIVPGQSLALPQPFGSHAHGEDES